LILSCHPPDRRVRASRSPRTWLSPKRYRAAARLARELQREAVPAAAFATTASRDFFQARIGCQIYQPLYGIDVAALYLRS